MINWNGISSDSLHVIVEYIPTRKFAKKKINVYSVPGRTGDIIDDEQAFENYTQQYNIFIEGDEVTNLPLRARAIANWLMEPNGYAVLRDSYDINSFRYAYFQGPMDIGTWFNIHGQATIEFVCDPHRYLDEGQKVGATLIASSSSDILVNPTSFPARPLINVYGAAEGAGTITISGKSIQVTDLSNPMTIDCATGQCYAGTENKNSSILCTDFPVLGKGSNSVSFTGSDITRVDIIPRWWTL